MLTEKEKRSIAPYVNEYLSRQWAKKIRKREMLAKRQIENEYIGEDYEQ
jgi:hypothetical protein